MRLSTDDLRFIGLFCSQLSHFIPPGEAYFDGDGGLCVDWDHEWIEPAIYTKVSGEKLIVLVSMRGVNRTFTCNLTAERGLEPLKKELSGIRQVCTECNRETSCISGVCSTCQSTKKPR